LRIALACSAFFLLAACAARPPQPISANQTERQARDDHTMCMLAGIRQNTPAFDDCRRKMQTAREEAIARGTTGKPTTGGEPARATTRIIIREGRPAEIAPPAPRQP
jgi:hypothetical protein